MITTRRILLNMVHALQNGQEPTQAADASLYALRAPAPTVDRGIPWEELIEKHMRVGSEPAVAEYIALR
jgi:hypothetical protein